MLSIIVPNTTSAYNVSAQSGYSAYPVQGAHTAHGRGAVSGQQALQLRRQASGSGASRTEADAQHGATGIIDASRAYGATIRDSRIKSKNTSNEIKKLRYNFKDVSSQILRSKTSRSAKLAASKAHREVLRLKRAKAGGQYDPEEVEAALEHAKSMERVAKKKAAHLEQEELIHITDKPGTSSIADELKEHPEKLAGDEEENAADATNEETAEGEPIEEISGGSTAAEAMSAELRKQMEALQEMAESQREYLSEELSAQISESLDEMMQGMEELLQDVTDQMDDMLEQMDLMVEMAAVPKEMNEADFKMLVTKHRTDEMKEMAEADREYLKFIFDKYAKMKAAASAGVSGGICGGSGMPGASSGAGNDAAAIVMSGSGVSSRPVMPTISIGQDAISVGDFAPSGGFDVSV